MSRQIDARQTHFPLARPFRIARDVRTAIDVITVSITDGPHRGRGEARPYARYGESIDSSLATIDKVRGAIEQGASREQLLQLMPAGAARSAVDAALWDLECRQSGQSIWQRLQQPRPDQLITAVTIGLDQPDKMAAEARRLAHVPLLKVKVDRTEPAARLQAVRHAAPRPAIIVDPNESWTMAEVQDLQPLLAELRVDLLEQPLPAGEDAGLQGFQPQVPIAADESVHVAQDVAALVDRYQVINIKLDKSGGLTAALELAAATRKAGLQLMTGCMVSSSLSIAPILPIAAGAQFIDLDGPWWLQQDLPGGIDCTDGLLSLPDPDFWG